jgi:hypothetical protein
MPLNSLQGGSRFCMSPRASGQESTFQRLKGCEGSGGIEYEGCAHVGDLIRTPHGDLLDVVFVTNAGAYSSANVQWAIDNGAPNFTRDSIAALCFRCGGALDSFSTSMGRIWAVRIQAQQLPRRNLPIY